ncbi:centrin-3-like [Bolinopsis microptera]|uniref:centrin-3-like n=1 Tax=Bolinopsis microptera TaxID=2820187 RepID=UPI0030799D95
MQMAEVKLGKRSKKRRELTNEQKEELREAFDLFDSDKDGVIDYHELKVAMKALGFDVKKAEVLKLLKDYDRDGSGNMYWDDFYDILKDKMLERNPEDEVQKAFTLFDDDGTGSINLRNLRRVARELGENMSDEELRAMIDEFDTSGTGEIDLNRFMSIMLGDS